MKFILIAMILTYGSDGGVALTTAEFDNKEKCQLAASKIASDFKTMFTQRAKTICVEK